jgi:hypothetical protein
MTHQIDQDRAIAMAPPPGPLVETNSLKVWRGRDRRPTDQAEQGGWTGGEPQTAGEVGAGVAAEGHADRPQDGDQSPGFSRISGHQLWQALREDTALTVRVPADEFPHPELEANHACAPGEVGQVALIVTVNGRGRHGTARTSARSHQN